MNKRGVTVKIIISIVAILILISLLSALLNKKEKIAGEAISQLEKGSENVAEEIIVGEEAKQADNSEKIKEFSNKSNTNDSLINNNTEENQTIYLQMLKDN